MGRKSKSKKTASKAKATATGSQEAEKRKAALKSSHPTSSESADEINSFNSKSTVSGEEVEEAEEAVDVSDNEEADGDESIHSQVERLYEAVAADGYDEVRQVYAKAYLATVLAVPDRSFERSKMKIIHCLQTRREYDVDHMKPEDLQQQINNGAIYWYGYDKTGHPIAWVRPKLFDYKNLDVQKELAMHVLFLEDGIKQFMPEGITTFIIVGDPQGLGIRDFDLGLMKGLIELVTNTYPDRLEGLYAGPVNIFVKFAYKLLSPLLPQRILSKVQLMRSPTDELLECIDEDQIPTFMKGRDEHPTFRREDETFDYARMVRTQKKKMAEYVAKQKYLQHSP